MGKVMAGKDAPSCIPYIIALGLTCSPFTQATNNEKEFCVVLSEIFLRTSELTRKTKSQWNFFLQCYRIS